MYYSSVAKTKALVNCAVTAHLIRTFVFADSWLSDAAAQITNTETLCLTTNQQMTMKLPSENLHHSVKTCKVLRKLISKVLRTVLRDKKYEISFNFQTEIPQQAVKTKIRVILEELFVVGLFCVLKLQPLFNTVSL